MVKRGKVQSANTETIVVKVTPELKERIEAATAELVPAGLEASVTDVVRILIMRGLKSMEPSCSFRATEQDSETPNPGKQWAPRFPIEGR